MSLRQKINNDASQAIRKRVRVARIKQALPIIILAVAIGIIMLWISFGSTLYSIYDEEGRVAQQGIGTVVNFTEPPVRLNNPDPQSIVSVQIDNKLALIDTYTPLHVGQKVSVDYTIGRSGVLYIHHFSPMVASK